MFYGKKITQNQGHRLHLRKTCRFCSMGTVGTKTCPRKGGFSPRKKNISLNLGWGIIGYVDVSCPDPKQPPGMIKTLKTPINNGTIIDNHHSWWCRILSINSISQKKPLEATSCVLSTSMKWMVVYHPQMRIGMVDEKNCHQLIPLTVDGRNPVVQAATKYTSYVIVDG